MKRSDAIDSIVYHCLSWDGLDTCGVPAEEIANDVLTHLEKLGMLPPFNHNNTDSYCTRDADGYEWESENET